MLNTPRTFLRPAQISDAEYLFHLNCDRDVMKFTGEQPFAHPLEASEFIRSKLIPQYTQYKMSRFLVFLHDGTFIGLCGLRYFSPHREVDLGFRFLKKYWGHGYAQETSKECLRYGLLDLKLNKIIAKAMPENVKSIRVLQKIGMNFKGYIHDPTDPIPFIVYELTQSELKKCDV